ncbi:MAG TPA: cbb3-type cytochrome oxidase assembly protein CcoS [Prolixibacteraceae bacterium]|nr:cbb3-type cytochrome oxidase assembly protein CcoS [Prolixibacteraceae bacterium]
MSVVFVLVFAAIVMAGAFLVAFIWSVRNGQYEDTYTPSVRILFDDPEVKKEEEEKSRSDQSQLAEKREKSQSSENVESY